MPNDIINGSNDPELVRTADNALVQNLFSTDPIMQGSKNAKQHFVDLKAGEAKQALRDLHLQGFDFNRIVKAGLNPDVLRKLYNEIEVPLTASPDLLQPKTERSGNVDVPTQSVSSQSIGGVQDRRPEVSQKDSNGDILSNENISYLATGHVDKNSQPIILMTKTEEKSKQSQVASAKSVKSSKFSNVNLLDKASGVKAGEKKTMDRKDYIARLLAAKTGKPAVSIAVPVSSETSIIADSGASAQVQPTTTAAATSPANVRQAASEPLNNSLGTQNEDSDVEAKRKAQTDLARRKIEALKVRENFSQQARPAISSNVMKDTRQTPIKSLPNVSAERPVPSRHSSYFSPASQKPPFSIPGLFMTSDAPEPANNTQPLANEVFTASSQGAAHSAFRSSQEDLPPQPTASARSPTADETLKLPETSSNLKFALPATASAMISSSRKRQKASDFIDSPSTRIKRPLGQQEDNSVIIDISDDEVSNDTSGDETLSTKDIVGRRVSPSTEIHVTAPGNGEEKPTKGLPRPIEISQRKKSVIKMLPTAQASGQSDLKGLKSKEMEIEAINRKIAELEQRIAIKAKQTTSRNHSPGTSSHITISPPPSEASQQTKNVLNLPLGVSDSQNDGVASVESHMTFPALAENSEILAAEQLDAEQQLERVERAKAEAETSLAAEISLASVAEPSLAQEVKIPTPQAEKDSSPWEGKQRTKSEEQKQVQGGEEKACEESKGEQTRREETNKSSEQEADRNFQAQEQRLAQGTRQERSQERKKSLEDQWQTRKSEIESGLPLLDAEVEKTRKRLEFLRQEIAGLETQLQKGIEGRQGLIEELGVLSQSREALPGPMDLDSSNISDVPKQPTSIDEIPGKYLLIKVSLMCSKYKD